MLFQDKLTVQNIVFNFISVAVLYQVDDMFARVLLPQSCQRRMNYIVNEAKRDGFTVSWWLWSRFLAISGITVLILVINFLRPRNCYYYDVLINVMMCSIYATVIVHAIVTASKKIPRLNCTFILQVMQELLANLMALVFTYALSRFLITTSVLAITNSLSDAIGISLLDAIQTYRLTR